METILIALVSLAVGGGGAFAYTKVQSAQKGAKADKILANAQNKASDIILKATETAKKEADELRRDLKKSEDKVAEREHAIERIQPLVTEDLAGDLHHAPTLRT